MAQLSNFRQGWTLLRSVVLLVIAISACTNREAVRQRHYDRGCAYLEQQQFKQAIQEFQSALAVDPKFADGHARLAEAYARSGDGASAVGAYVRAADLLPDDLDAQVTAGRYLLSSGQFEDALARANTVIARDARDVRAHVLRGNALSSLNDIDAALAAMREAIRLDPARGPTYTQLGMLQLAKGRTTEALASLKKAIDLDPQWIGGYLALANQQWNTGDVDAAEDSLRAALAEEPDNETANRAMAALSLAANRTVDAEKFLRALA